MKFLKMMFGVLMFALLTAACGPQSAPPPTPADVDMSLRAEPEPPAVGDATLIVTLKDASGAPVDGAALKAHGDMDHAGMMPVDGETSESAAGEYRVPFKWTMGGGWIVTITAQLPNNGGEITKTFNFFVEAVSGESIVNRQNHMNVTATPENPMNMPERADINVTP